jgi:hypothetical protein
MVEGESGILAISSPSDRPIYEPSKRRLTWPNLPSRSAAAPRIGTGPIFPEAKPEHQHVPGLRVAPRSQLVAPGPIMLWAAQALRLIGRIGRGDRTGWQTIFISGKPIDTVRIYVWFQGDIRQIRGSW